ncbi:hypothetical protein O3G_MSEX015346, partial [Manduca sexta]
MSIEKLFDIILKGLSDSIHSAVNHTLSSLTTLAPALCSSPHWALLVEALNSLVSVEMNSYWLCKVNLCRLYEKLPYKKLYTLYPGYYARSKMIMDTLIRLLGDHDQKVRSASTQAITTIIPNIYPSKRHTSTTMVCEIASQHSRQISFDNIGLSLDLVRDIYFYNDLPEQLKSGETIRSDCLRTVVGDLMAKLLASSCKHYSQGLLEALQAISKRWSPWKNIEAYSDQGIVSYCLENLDYCNGTVAVRTLLMDLCCMNYPVEIHNIMRHKTSNRDIFERDSQSSKDKWQHLEDSRVANLAEKFLQVTLKTLNVLVHLIEEVNPTVHLNRSGIALPGSPVRRKTQDSIPVRKSSTPTDSLDDKGSLRKKPPTPATSLKANFSGHFYNEPFYMKLYESLRATYFNHKINLDPKSSIFHLFLTTTLNCLAIQLELSTEKETGNVTEEILYYLKAIMPLCPNLTVYCITQLLKCLFGTNTLNQYSDYMSISDKKDDERGGFFDDVMVTNPLNADKGSRRSSVSSTTSQKLSLDSKNPRMIVERQLLVTLENFAKNKSDRKWSTNKKELERYIRLFEPVVIQALKSYTMQNDIPLQCQVLNLLNQLLMLRVNYCMLDSDQIFIGFLMKQLDLVEHHEIPNCCDLVHSILMFLVQLSSSKHHTKQIIEIPKLIQLCDGLMASGAHAECTAGLEPVAVRVFSTMGGGSILGRAQQQEAQATREVLFYMLQKTMHQPKVLDLVSCVLSLSQEHPESYYRYSELASDTLLNLLSQRSIELDTAEAISSLERLIDSVYKDVLLEQSRVEILLKILFKAPPDQATTPVKLKLRYLSIIMVLLRKILILIPESEILLSINYLKATCISPQSIFFNVKPDVDPLNVQNVENGLSEAVHLTWLLVNRVHILVSQYQQHMVQSLVSKVQQTAGASGLLLQAVAARCQSCLKDEFALNTYKILSMCHESQSGPLVFLICRIIGKLEPAIAVRFAKLAMERCKMLKELPVEKINMQLSKEDVQVALELLQRDKIYVRYSSLVMELNSLASSVFDLSPLDLSQDRAINPQYIVTTNVDSNWLMNQVKSRCCQSPCYLPRESTQGELAQLLSNLSYEDLMSVMSCQEFNRKLLGTCFKVACEAYLRDFIDVVSAYEAKEIEKDNLKMQREMKIAEEMTSSIDSNKLNVTNTLHVFKKSDSKESKSQFFIPITDNENVKEFGNLQISEEEIEMTIPELPKLYRVAVTTLDKSLAEVIRLFPRQSRPHSQSETFNLNIEHTIDRYTRRCHQVFQDKLFYREFVVLHTALTGFIDSLKSLMQFIDDADCDLLEKCMENLLPTSLAKNIAIFSVISLQYLSFLIKNKSIAESPVHADVSFRATVTTTDSVSIDNVIAWVIDNVSKALDVEQIWAELNVDSNSNRTQSAVNCLYAILKHLVKDTKPLVLKQYMQTQDPGPRSDMMITGDKLVTLWDYWERTFYANGPSNVLGKCYKEPIEKLLSSLSRLDLLSNIALIPPIAWSSVDVISNKEQIQKIDLPLQALQDMDVLEAFLFRAQCVGWTGRRQFEERWVALLAALQTDAPHTALRATAHLLLSTAKGRHVARDSVPTITHGMQRLRNILIGTSAYRLFDDVNLERIPLQNDDFDGYHYAQFSTEYLQYASDITDDAPYKVRKEVKRTRKNKEIDINSCLQILMDVITQMLDPKSPTGVAGRAACVWCVEASGCALS